jgi:hypothetical protein
MKARERGDQVAGQRQGQLVQQHDQPDGLAKVLSRNAAGALRTDENIEHADRAHQQHVAGHEHGEGRRAADSEAAKADEHEGAHDGRKRAEPPRPAGN